MEIVQRRTDRGRSRADGVRPMRIALDIGSGAIGPPKRRPVGRQVAVNVCCLTVAPRRGRDAGCSTWVGPRHFLPHRALTSVGDANWSWPLRPRIRLVGPLMSGHVRRVGLVNRGFSRRSRAIAGRRLPLRMRGGLRAPARRSSRRKARSRCRGGSLTVNGVAGLTFPRERVSPAPTLAVTTPRCARKPRASPVNLEVALVAAL